VPNSLKNGRFGDGFPNLLHNFPPKSKDFEPTNVITLHFFVFKNLETLGSHNF
jgi:hypothetical protein